VFGGRLSHRKHYTVRENTYTMARDVGTFTICYVMMGLVQVKWMQLGTDDVGDEECDITVKPWALKCWVRESN